MARVVNLYDAKTQLSKLVDCAARGEEIVIAKNGTPRARLVPVSTKRTRPRRPGGWKGKLWVAADFDELPEEVLAAFDGREE
jgi:prevent-host-death family protein